MPTCDLTILFDRPDRDYTAGESVTGVLRVQVNAACTCKALTVASQWRSHGKGDRDEGEAGEEVLFQGEWLPGTLHEYAFDFLLPAGPVSYHGTIVNVDWYIKARADIPWAFDPKAEEPFFVLAGPVPYRAQEDDLSGLAPATRDIIHRDLRGRPLGCVLMFSSLFLLLGIGTTLAGLSSLTGGSSSLDLAAAVFSTVVGAIFLLVPILILQRVAGNRIAARGLGPVEAEAVPGSLRAGERLTCRVRFTPTATVWVDGIVAVLVGSELAVSGSGSTRTVHTHTLHEQEIELAGPRSFQVGEAVHLEANAAIQQDATPSFHAPCNEVRWSVELRIRRRLWPYWSRTVRLVVHE